MKMRKLTKLASPCILLAALAILVNAPNTKAATPEQIEQAITNGLAWLAGQQDAGNGSWHYEPPWADPCVDVATTGLAVLKFVERAKELELDPFDEDPGSPTYYEYATNVVAGFDYIFTHAMSDANGVHFLPCWSDVYTTGIATMAIAASNAPSRVITTGALAGQTYQQALQWMMNWMAHAQQKNVNYACDEGGWDYGDDPDDLRDWADQSNSGYASLGIGFASAPPPSGFGLAIPGGVVTGLDIYINNVQDPVDGDNYDGGSWYEPCVPYKWVNILKTGNLLYEMALVGDGVSDTRVQNAISYIETHWNDTGQQPEFLPTSLGWKDSYQAMFTMMKGFEAFAIDTITVGASDIDWFDKVSDVIVANQNLDGSWKWINSNITEGEQSPVLRAAWAMLTLERVVPTVTQPVYVDIKPGSCPNPFRLPQEVVDVRGKLPVAILGTEDFDVTTIDPMTVRMTREGVEAEVAPVRYAYEDVATPFEGELCDCHDLNGDGYLDLTLKFKRKELANVLNLYDAAGETIPLTITGNLYEELSGTPIRGEDCVRIKVKK